MWTEIKKIIRKSKRIVITSHVDPDGDALGSELALYHYFKSLGKEPVILNATAPGRNFEFIGKKKEVLVYNEKRDKVKIEKADAAFIVDISEWGRLGNVGKALKESNAIKVCIDHHICEKKFVDFHLIDTKASSTGEMIYELIKKMKKPLSPKIAEPLYISALTDTGSFRYQNTSPKTHLMASELLQYGVNPLAVFNQIYEQYSPERFQLLGHFLLSMKLECKGQLAWGAITHKMVKKAKANMDESEGFVEILRTISSVEMSLIFRESEKNQTRVSLRSKERADVHAVAKRFGGGGHKRASGLTVDLPLEKAIPKVLTEARKSFKS